MGSIVLFPIYMENMHVHLYIYMCIIIFGLYLPSHSPLIFISLFFFYQPKNPLLSFCNICVCTYTHICLDSVYEENYGIPLPSILSWSFPLFIPPHTPLASILTSYHVNVCVCTCVKSGFCIWEEICVACLCQAVSFHHEDLQFHPFSWGDLISWLFGAE